MSAAPEPPGPDELSDRLATWLSATEGEAVTVEGLELASAGARRINALFSAVSEQGRRALALTMIPSASIQLLDIETEAETRRVAETAGVPVPHVFHVCSDPAVLGGPFFVSQAVDGETVPRRVLRLVHAQGLGDTVTAQLGRAMARLHTVGADQAPPALALEQGPIEAAMARAEELYSELLEPSPTFAWGLRWLERHAPAEPERVCLVHSDIRNGNIIVGPDGLRAILDWETARLGDPIEDLAWPCQRMWRFREDALTVGGFAGVEVLRQAYTAAGGHWDEDRFRWWRLMGTVRWGMSLAGQARSHLDGSFPSIVMAASGRRVSELEYDALLLLDPDATSDQP